MNAFQSSLFEPENFDQSRRDESRLFGKTEHFEPNSYTFAQTINHKNLLQDLFKAYYDARKNKRRTNSQLAFERHYEQNLFDLWEQIINRSYTPQPSTVFIKTKPVIREVFAAQFVDRVIHHYLFNVLSPLFEKSFIQDSYSCRKGKGTLYGINRVQGFLKDMHIFGHRKAFVLKLDIQNYFYSLDRQLLFEMIISRLQHEPLFGYDKEIIFFLLTKIIFNDPTQKVIKKGTKEEWETLPKSKSLFYAKAGKGFAIGNLTSQLFSNIYLNDFDHFVQEKLHIACYGRYVDDFVMVHPSAEYLKSCIPFIQDFLKPLGLMLHPKKQYFQHYQKGLPFLGAYIKPFSRFVENRTKKNAFALVRSVSFLPIEECSTKKHANLRSRLNSYFGIMKPHNSYHLRKKLFHALPASFWQYFHYRLDYSAVMMR